MTSQTKPKFNATRLTKFFVYLDNLRESGTTNMFGAAPWLANAFEISLHDAREVLGMWTKEFSTEPAGVRAAAALAAAATS